MAIFEILKVLFFLEYGFYGLFASVTLVANLLFDR